MNWFARSISGIALATLTLVSSEGMAQTVSADLAINHPDEASWKLFAHVVGAVPSAPGKILFETWASNEDTFNDQPTFPGSKNRPNCDPSGAIIAASDTTTPLASPKILNIPALQKAKPAKLAAQISPDGSEEVRRNRETFDFIVCNHLYTRTGLGKAFKEGKPITFPIGAMEVKANWVPATNHSAENFYISEAPNGKKYALVSMHVISKVLPNWTWATFEHETNLGRCDYIGCHDAFGAIVADVQPNSERGRPYNPCVKSNELKALFSSAGLPALWEKYCLKGSQTDFVTSTGVPTRLGNSVTENGFVNTSSCITCHGRAAVNANGKNTTPAGFINPPVPALCPDGRPCSPNGAPNPDWYWRAPGKPDQTLTALQTDFVWSIALEAIAK